MSNLVPEIDPDGLLEYSVVFTDRSLNHMSQAFQQVMRNISSTLKQAYNASSVIVLPGGGSYGMEAVARQLATDKKCLVIRNGFFSYRWSQIFEMGGIPAAETVLKARAIESGPQAPFAPAPVAEVVAAIREQKPDLVFAPHVETASGMLLPDDYLESVADAVHEVGGLFVLDCIASGTLWVDMKARGVDVLISAPQKGWSSSPGSALIMLGEKAERRLEGTRSTSFSMDLLKWQQIMQAYEGGGHAYHATMPTDALVRFHDAMEETRALGFAESAVLQQELGDRIRALLKRYGFKSVAAEGFEAPGVVVCYTNDEGVHKGSSFIAEGLQTAAGVPLQCDEPEDFKTFRLGLFGLDKLKDIDRTVRTLEAALEKIVG